MGRGVRGEIKAEHDLFIIQIKLTSSRITICNVYDTPLAHILMN